MFVKLTVMAWVGAVIAQLTPILGHGTWMQTAIVVVTLATAAWKVLKKLGEFHSDFRTVMIEHNMVMDWYVENHPQYDSIDDLPTRKALSVSAGGRR